MISQLASTCMMMLDLELELNMEQGLEVLLQLDKVYGATDGVAVSVGIWYGVAAVFGVGAGPGTGTVVGAGDMPVI